MNKEEMIEKLELFNRGALEFDKVKLPRDIKEFRASTDYVSNEVTYNIPNDRDIKSYCCDIRKFTQGNDELKIEKLQPIYQSNIIPQEYRQMHCDTISKYYKMKKMSPPYLLIPLPKEIREMRNEQIFDLFMYGNIVHYSKEQRELYQYLEKNNSLFPQLRLQFLSYIDNLWPIISDLVFINRLTLKYLNKTEEGYSNE